MKKNTILLVENHESDVISIQHSLKKLDIEYTLYTACNSKEALAILDNSEEPVVPDVIFLVLNRPKMNGLEFLKAIRSSNRFKQTKIFIVTTSAEIADRKMAEQLGISGYIIKPLSYTSNNRKIDSVGSLVQLHLRKILLDS